MVTSKYSTAVIHDGVNFFTIYKIKGQYPTFRFISSNNLLHLLKCGHYCHMTHSKCCMCIPGSGRGAVCCDICEERALTMYIQELEKK